MVVVLFDVDFAAVCERKSIVRLLSRGFAAAFFESRRLGAGYILADNHICMVVVAGDFLYDDIPFSQGRGAEWTVLTVLVIDVAVAFRAWCLIGPVLKQTT